MATSSSSPVLAARQHVQTLHVRGVKDPKRVLLAMLDNLPQPGLDNIAVDINACADNEELKQLSEHYVCTVFKPLKATGGATPRPTPSPLSNEETDTNELDENLGHSQLHLPTRVLESVCLPRDGYKCVLTGLWSSKTPDNLLPAGFDKSQRVATQTCHIIPLSLAQYGNTDQYQHDSCCIWSSLCRMFPSLRSRIADHLENINSAGNLFTAADSVHGAFGSFNLAFDQLPGQNRYRVEYWKNIGIFKDLIPNSQIIQLQSNYNSTAPFPDPYLLQIHLTVARILHASGLAEILERAFDDYYSLPALARDGSTNIPYLKDIS